MYTLYTTLWDVLELPELFSIKETELSAVLGSRVRSRFTEMYVEGVDGERVIYVRYYGRRSFPGKTYQDLLRRTVMYMFVFLPLLYNYTYMNYVHKLTCPFFYRLASQSFSVWVGVYDLCIIMLYQPPRCHMPETA